MTEQEAATVATPREGFSVVHLRDYWYVACETRDLKSAPLARTILGVPLVLFRDESGKACAFLDRCPHRNVPLSQGKVAGGLLQCCYHGWQFAGDGRCVFVPALCGEAEAKGRKATVYSVQESDGFVWVFMNPDKEPSAQPFQFTQINEAGYTSVRRTVSVESTLWAALENALDVPHTAFLHGGLFRKAEEKKTEIEAVVKVRGDGVEAEYIGEPRPPGLAAKLLSPSGGVVTHFDRFLLPSIAQVEYKLGCETHILITSAMTPVDDFSTKIHAVISFRLRIPGWLIRPFLEPLANKIFQQDADILKLQTQSIQRFGGEKFMSTEVDILGLHIWKLLQKAQAGEGSSSETAPKEHRIRLHV